MLLSLLDMLEETVISSEDRKIAFFDACQGGIPVHGYSLWNQSSLVLDAGPAQKLGWAENTTSHSATPNRNC